MIQPMMALLRPRLGGTGVVAATRLPAWRTGLGTAHTVCAPVARAEGQASRVGAAPQREPSPRVSTRLATLLLWNRANAEDLTQDQIEDQHRRRGRR